MNTKDIEKELLRFWQIKSVTELDGSPKIRKANMYKEWTSENYYVSNLHPKYYVDHKGYNLRWISFALQGDTLYESDGYTSLVTKIEPIDDGFKVYTKNSIYTFISTNITFETLINKLETHSYQA